MELDKIIEEKKKKTEVNAIWKAKKIEALYIENNGNEKLRNDVKMTDKSHKINHEEWTHWNYTRDIEKYVMDMK